MSRILAVLLGCSLVAGLLTAPPAHGVPNFSAGSFHSVGGNPERVLDTRSGLGERLGAVDVFGYFVRVGAGQPSASGVGAYIPLSPQLVTAVVLRGRTPGGFSLPAEDRAWAFNLVMTTDRPGQPVALGIYAPHHPWTGSPVVSSSAWLQPTELTVDARAGSVVIGSLIDTDVALHCHVTGIYWLPHGV